MAPSDITNTWANIRQGVKDAELLIGEKKYNLSMIKSRQVLELMVNYLCDTASVSGEDLASSIDELYNSEWISKTTSEHYHKIRMLGNKAVHEGNDNGYDANQAYHLLSQEVYTFANEYKSKAGRSGGRNSGTQRSTTRNSQARNSGSRASGTRGGGSRSSSGRDQGRGDSRSSGARNPGARGGGSRSASGRGARSRRRQSTSGFSPTPTDFVRLGLILLVVVVIVLLVRFLMPKKEDDTPETSTTPVDTSFFVPDTTVETTPVETETMAPTTPAPVYKTTSSLNVRSEPSTAGDILGLLEPGTIINYVEDYDDEWTVIDYNGTRAYVSSQYLAHD